MLEAGQGLRKLRMSRECLGTRGRIHYGEQRLSRCHGKRVAMGRVMTSRKSSSLSGINRGNDTSPTNAMHRPAKHVYA